MAKFRKRPVVIDAVQYAGKGNLQDSGGNVPEWLWDALEKGTIRPTNGTDPLIIGGNLRTSVTPRSSGREAERERI